MADPAAPDSGQGPKDALYGAVLLAIFGFFAGALGLGWTVPFLLAGVVAYTGWHNQKAHKLRERGQILSRAHGYENLRLLCPPGSLPPWIDYSDTEQCEWIRKMFHQLWPYASISTEDTLKLSLNRVFDAVRPGFLKRLELTVCQFNAAPEILGVNTVLHDDAIYLDLPMRIRGDSDIVIAAGAAGVQLNVKVNDLEISGTLRLVFTELNDTLPCFNAVCVSFVSKPDVECSLSTGSVPLTAIPGLAQFLEEMIKDQMAPYVVWPKKVVVPLNFPEVIPPEEKSKLTEGQLVEKERAIKKKYMDEYQAIMDRQMDISGKGLLRVNVIEANGLKNVDVIGKSDPYVVLFVGGTKAKTKVKENTLDPKFNERFEWIIYDLQTQNLTCYVKDYDIGSNDLLGKVEVPLTLLKPGTLMRRTLDLERGQGTLTLELEFKPFIAVPPRDEPVLGPEWDPIDSMGKYHNGYLTVIVKCLDRMKVTKPNASTVVKLLLDGEERQSWAGYPAAPPLPNDQVYYEQDFTFPLTTLVEATSATSKKLKVVLEGANTGTVEIDLVNEILIHGSEGKIQWFNLEGGGRIRLSTSIKHVSPDPSELERRRTLADINAEELTQRRSLTLAAGSAESPANRSMFQFAILPALQAGGAVLVTYLAGYFFGFFSIIGLLLLVAVAASYGMLSSKQYKPTPDAKDIDVEFSREDILKAAGGDAKLQAMLQDLPPWMTFPSVEKNEWLNELVQGLWPYVRPAANKTIDDSVNPILDSVRPSFLSTLKLVTDLGATPPVFTGVSHYERSKQGEQVIIDLQLFWAGDTKAVVSVGAGPVVLPITVKDVCIEGTLRLRFGPLVTVYPCFSDIGISFSSKPYVNLTAMLGVIPLTSIPGLGSEIHHQLHAILNSALVWPTEIPVNIVDAATVAKLKKVFKQTSAGILRVIMRSAKGLKNVDGILGKSDPYVSLILRNAVQDKKKTKTIKNNLNPVWNETFEFLVDPHEPLLSIIVKDYDRFTSNQVIGETMVHLSDLPPDVLVQFRDIPLDVGSKQHGTISFDVEYKPFAPTARQVPPFAEAVVEGATEVGWSTGVAFVNVIDGHDLSTGGGDNPDAYVVGSVGSTKHKTDVFKDTKNPKFNSLLSCTVKDFSLQILRLDVFDAKLGKDTLIGRRTFNLADIIRSGTAQGRYALEDCPRGTHPELDLHVVVRSVNDRSDTMNFEEAKALRSKLDAQAQEVAEAAAAQLGVSPSPNESTDEAIARELDDTILSAGAPDAAEVAAIKIAGPGILRIEVDKCENLPRTDSHGATDPYVNVYVNKTKKKSRVVKKNCNPVWHNEGWDFHIKDPATTSIVIKVKDHDLFGGRLLGSARVPISDFTKDTLVAHKYNLDLSESHYRALDPSKPSTVSLSLVFYPDPEAQVSSAQGSPSKRESLDVEAAAASASAAASTSASPSKLTRADSKSSHVVTEL